MEPLKGSAAQYTPAWLIFEPETFGSHVHFEADCLPNRAKTGASHLKPEGLRQININVGHRLHGRNPAFITK